MMTWWITLGAALAAPGDTGAVPPDSAVVDTGSPIVPARSASELAGEEGGCRCSSSGRQPLAPLLLLGLVVAGRRRA